MTLIGGRKMTFADIEQIASERLVSIAEARAACEASGKTLEEFLSDFSAGLAHRFLTEQVAFEHCDAVMSGLHDVILCTVEGRVASEVAWSIFLAFDAGEFIPPSDPPDTDPVEKYTRPQLREVLREVEEKKPIQPPQRNAGSRPSSGDSPASETPSSLGPRG